MKFTKFFLVISLISLVGCGATKESPFASLQINTPINIPSNNNISIKMSKLKIALPQATPVGKSYAPAGIAIQDYYASSFDAESLFEYVSTEVHKELAALGFTISEDKEDLFEVQDYSEERFLLGAKITELEFNEYGKMAWTTPKSEFVCGMNIEWQIYDKVQNKIIISQETSGYASIMNVPIEAFSKTVIASLHNFMADQQVVTTLVEASHGTTENKNLIQEVSYSLYQGSPMNIEEVKKATIVVKTSSGSGSGFIINSQGYALTAAHVVAQSNKIVAYIEGGKPIEAHVIFSSEKYDIALIKLGGTGYSFLQFENKNQIKVGQDIHVFGNPFQESITEAVSVATRNQMKETIEPSVTKGVISGVRMSEQGRYTLYQTDSAVNPGNSGGALVSTNGAVIGMVIGKFANWDTEGLGFAVSVQDIAQILNLKKQ